MDKKEVKQHAIYIVGHAISAKSQGFSFLEKNANEDSPINPEEIRNAVSQEVKNMGYIPSLWRLTPDLTDLPGNVQFAVCWDEKSVEMAKLSGYEFEV
jgi:hypothetical protein